eukprot:6491537-Amphidinium_carterae.4
MREQHCLCAHNRKSCPEDEEPAAEAAARGGLGDEEIIDEPMELGAEAWRQLQCGKSAIAKAGGVPEPIQQSGPELKLCKICMGEKMVSEFDVDKHGRLKGHSCAMCNAATESLQRTLRAVWKDGYKTKYAILKSKANQELFRSVVVSLAKDPATKKKRGLKVTAELVAEEVYRGKRKSKSTDDIPMTWEHFNLHYKKTKNGGFSQVQNESRWTELVANPNTPRDRDGVAGGVAGQLRLWLPAYEKITRAIDELEGRKHTKSHTKKGGVEAEDVEAFLEDDDNMVLAEEVGKGGVLLPSEEQQLSLVQNLERALGLELSESRMTKSAAASSQAASSSNTAAATSATSYPAGIPQ